MNTTNITICKHCGCEGGMYYGLCSHCTPKEYLDYVSNHGTTRLDNLNYALDHYEDYCNAIDAFNENRPDSVNPIKLYSKKWITRLKNKEVKYQANRDRYVSVRIIRKDVKKLCRDFSLDEESILTDEIPKSQEFKSYKVNKHVNLYKYYTIEIHYSVNKRDHIRHEYRIQGKYQYVHDLLSTTCGVKPRGCRVPVFIPTDPTELPK